MCYGECDFEVNFSSKHYKSDDYRILTTYFAWKNLKN
jgi:hypothetical protein